MLETAFTLPCGFKPGSLPALASPGAVALCASRGRQGEGDGEWLGLGVGLEVMVGREVVAGERLWRYFWRSSSMRVRAMGEGCEGRGFGEV